jgi:hypothetical protein
MTTNRMRQKIATKVKNNNQNYHQIQGQFGTR